MDDQLSGSGRFSWTWADMFLTYRFWGLLLFYSLCLASSGLVSTWLPYSLEEMSPSDASMSTLAGGLYSAIAISVLLGFSVAWAATRCKAKIVLLVAGTIQLVGVLLLTFDAITAISLRFVGAVLFGIGTGAITLGIPAVLAGGRGGAQAFVIAFGLLLAVVRASDTSLTLIVGFLWDQYGSSTLAASTGMLAFLGLLALLPVDPELFTGTPRARAYNWVVRPRSPVLVVLGSLIGLICYYFLYRFHGEIASLRPSPKLLSPWGALFTVLLFPLAFSAVLGVMFGATAVRVGEVAWVLAIGVSLIEMILLSVVATTLVEPLNELAEEHGKPSLIAPWVVFVFGILIPPVAMGLIQRALNQSILMTEQEAA